MKLVGCSQDLENGGSMKSEKKFNFMPGARPFIIAEMSGNHNGSLDRALSIVEAAANAGANAIKLQTYTADTMTLNLARDEFVVENPSSLWNGRTLYDLYEEAHTPWEWHEPIFAKARELGLTPFSTPFDSTSVDFLESLNVSMYKIASFENIDIPLIKKVASTGKPIIISTGLASVSEIYEAVEAAKGFGCPEIVLLKTTSSYPASPANSNLKTIPHMRELFNCEVGLSDHTLGIGVAIASIAMGVSVVEKHFTLSRDDGGVDSAFSLDVSELKLLVQESNRAWEAIGQISYGPSEGEMGSSVFRRSLYVVKDIQSGEAFTEDNVRAIRPGFGLAPKYMDFILGKKANRDLKRGLGMSLDYIG